jgi:hypothetical protein
MRADIQGKPLGFQELTPPKYRCMSICVTRLTRLQQTPAHPLILKTTGFLEQRSKHFVAPKYFLEEQAGS